MSSPGTLRFGQVATKPSAPPAGYDLIYVKTDDVLYIQDSAGVEVALGSASAITSLNGDATATGPGASTITINFVGGASAASIAAAAAAISTATSSNTPNTVVERDGSGNFAAGTITASLNGNANTATTSISFSGSLLGDVTGTQGATVVSFVGGKTATDVASATATVDAATSLNTASTLVKRDASGDFAAHIITASLVGNVTGNLTGNVTGNVSGSAATFTGSLAGDVTGTQSATSVVKIQGISVNSTAPTDAQFLVYQSGITAYKAASMSGDATMTDTGVVSIVATTNSTITTLSALSLPGSQVTGNISGNAANVTGVVGILHGGTGQTTATTAFDALSPLTTLGDTLYYDGTHNVRLSGNTTNAREFLTSQGSGGLATAPLWSALVSGDIPNNAANTTGTASNITATSNSTLTTLTALSLPTTQLTGTLQAAQFPALTGDVTNTAGSLSITVVGIQGHSVSSTAPTDAQVLIWNNGTSKWTPASISGDVTITNAGVASITSATVTAKLLTGYVVGTNTPLAATNSILTAFENLQGQLNAITAGDVTTVGTYNTFTAAANGATISGNSIYFQSATITVPGMVDNTTQSFSGNKTFTGSVSINPSSDIRILSLQQFSATPATSSNYLTMYNSAASIVAFIDSLGDAAFADGNAITPAYGFRNNVGIGMYRQGTNILAFSTSSTGAMYIDAGGQVGLATATPGDRLDVHNGNIRISNNNALKFSDNQGTPNFVSVKAPATVTASYTITLPPAQATAAFQVLTNDGTGLTSWATPSISLTSQVTGILPIANGGTNNAGPFTAGSVIFSNGTQLTQDNAKFFWDDTNFTLGLGTNTPVAASILTGINTSGAARPIQLIGYGTGSSTGLRGDFARGTVGTPAAAQNGDILNFISGRGYGASQFAAASTGVIQIAAAETFTNTSNATYMAFKTTNTGSVTSAEAMRISPAGNLLIGTTTDSGTQKLQVNGNSNVGTVTAGTWNGSVIGIAYGGTALSTTPSNGQLLIGNGTNYTLATLTAGTGISIANAAGSITITSSGITPLVTKTANYTILSTDGTILCDTSGGAFTLTLPSPSGLSGQIWRVIDSTGFFQSNNLTLAPHSTEKIEGLAASKVLQTPWGWFTITTNGTDWFVGG